MKQTSIKKLSEVYNSLNALYNGESVQHDYKDLANLIQDVIRAEATTKVKGSKFNIYDYVSKKDEYRPQMCGVYHNEGWRVACDAHILFAEECEYPAEYEGKTLLKDGSFVEEGKYPKWRSVIPNDEGYQPFEINAQTFYGWLEEKRAAFKTETGKGVKFDQLWRVRVGVCLLMAEKFDKLLTAMNYLGTTKLFVKEPRRAVYAKTDKGLVLLMPALSGVEDIDVLTLA